MTWPAFMRVKTRLGLGIISLLVICLGLVLGCLGRQTAAAPAEGLEFSYTLKEPGQVSVAIYDAAGRMVRPLQYGEKQEAGTYTLAWDGLDRYGQPQPPGTYEWRLLRTPGFRREFLANVGATITWEPFTDPEGRINQWPGNHAGPNVVSVDPAGDVYIGSISSEGPPHIIKMSPDGSRLLASTGTWGFMDGLIGMARIGNVLYILMANGTLEILRADNCQRVYGMGKLHRFAAERIPFANLRHPGDESRRTYQMGQMALAAGKDYLVVTYARFDEVRFLWPQEDTIARTESVTVPQAGGVAVAPDDRVFVTSGTRIVCLAPGTHELSVVVDDPGLTKPGHLTYDPANNDLIVINGNHLRRYSAADGKLIAVYGRPEGRTYGVFNPMDFDTLHDVAADGQGGFFTVEEYPRRVAHFRGREKLTLVRQWIGGLAWGWQAALDPEDPTVTYLGVDGKHLGRAVIDYATGTWTLTHLYDLPEHFSWGANSAEFTRGDMFPGLGTGWKVRHVAGETYLVHTTGGGVAVVRVDEREHRLVPVARLAGMHPTLDRNKPPAWWLEACQRAGYKPDSTDYTHFAYSWSDTNRNGQVDIEEIHLGSVGNRYTEGSVFVDEDWNVYIPTHYRPTLWTVVPNEGTESLPQWNWDHEQPGQGAFPEAERSFLLGAGLRGLFVDPQGNITAVAQGTDLADIAPVNWPNNASSVSRLVRWDAQGRQLFSVGYHTPRKDRPPGGFADIRAVLGQIRGCLIVRDACASATAWTEDGLYAGSFMDGWVSERRVHAGLNQDDDQDGQVLINQRGEVLWCCNDGQSTLIYRVEGWDGWERQSGKLVLRTQAPCARRQGTGLQGEYFASPDLGGTPVLRRLDPEIWFGPMWGDHREVAAKNPWFKPGEGAGLTAGSGSARWKGWVEAPLGEEFTFHVFAYGVGDKGARVRLWLNGQLAIDAWDNVTPQKVNEYKRTRDLRSAPLRLSAGQMVPITLEYSAAGGEEAHLHLFWESRSHDLLHIRRALLYPELPGGP